MVSQWFEQTNYNDVNVVLLHYVVIGLLRMTNLLFCRGRRGLWQCLT